MDRCQLFAKFGLSIQIIIIAGLAKVLIFIICNLKYNVYNDPSNQFSFYVQSTINLHATLRKVWWIRSLNP